MRIYRFLFIKLIVSKAKNISKIISVRIHDQSEYQPNQNKNQYDYKLRSCPVFERCLSCAAARPNYQHNKANDRDACQKPYAYPAANRNRLIITNILPVNRLLISCVVWLSVILPIAILPVVILLSAVLTYIIALPIILLIAPVSFPGLLPCLV